MMVGSWQCGLRMFQGYGNGGCSKQCVHYVVEGYGVVSERAKVVVFERANLVAFERGILVSSYHGFHGFYGSPG